MRLLILGLLIAAVGVAQTPPSIGIGCTTAYHIDADCDGYGVGTAGYGQVDPAPLLGPDADDGDATVHNYSQAIAKWGTLNAFFAHLDPTYVPTGAVYLSTTGSDTTCHRVTNIADSSAPCLTISQAQSLFTTAGDAIIMRGGVYSMASAFYIYGNGTPTARNMFIAYPGELPILYAPGDPAGGAIISSPTSTNASYWALDGAAVVSAAGQYGYGIDEQGYGQPNGITIRNTEFVGCYDQIFIQGGEPNLLIEGNYFHNLLPGGEHNIYIGANPGPTPGLKIQHNIISQAGTAGGHNIHLNGRFYNYYIGGNIMYGSENESMGWQSGPNNGLAENNIVFTTVHGALYELDYADSSQDDNNVAFPMNHNVFRNNTFYFDGADYLSGNLNCTLPIIRFTDISGGSCYSFGGVVSGNSCAATVATSQCGNQGGTFSAGTRCTGGTYVDPSGWGGGSTSKESGTCCGNSVPAACQGGPGSCSYSNTYNIPNDLGHNTFDNNIFATNCPVGANATVQIQYDLDIDNNGGLQWLNTSNWRNNIIVNLGPATTFMGSSNWSNASLGNETLTSTYTFAQFESNLAAGSGTNLQSNPLFVAANPAWYNAPGNWNLRVSAGSPAIGAAYAADASSVDITGKARGASPDIGAYQFSSTIGITPTSLPSGQVSTVYSQTLTAVGFTGTVTWSKTSGTLPTGLSGCTSGTGTTCTISGTPTTTAGSPFSFTISATDGTHTAANPYSITIVAGPTAASSTMNSGVVSSGVH